MFTSLAFLIAASGAPKGVPSLGAAILWRSSPTALSERLLAQAGDLEPDMNRARERLGHDSNELPLDASEEQRLEHDMRRARRHLGPQQDATGTAAKPSRDERRPSRRGPRRRDYGDDYYNGDDYYDEPAPRRRGRRLPREYRYEATLDGHGPAYYLGWGIADWVIAGSLWVGSGYMWVYAAVLASLADEPTRDDPWAQSRENAGIRKAAFLVGALAFGLGITGAIVAFRAGKNIGTFRELKAEQRAHRQGLAPIRRRAPQERARRRQVERERRPNPENEIFDDLADEEAEHPRATTGDGVVEIP